MEKEELLRQIADAVVEMEEDTVEELAQQSLTAGIDAYETIDLGLAKGMERAGQLFDEEEYFVPELLMCSDAMNVGIDVLKPHLKSENVSKKGKVVIGVVEGDTHDIGKNLVRLMMETGGFEVLDLGRDIPPAEFVSKAEEYGADIIGIATLMTTTMPGMKEVVDILADKGIRDKFKVIVGGGPISPAFAKKIGADGYARNAADAVKVAEKLLSNTDLALGA
ncbi:MAG: corrinoid protein [Anaerovibrio sp.]|jgi:corrinoid protein of di/trimethylamine methyltransferase|uniref:Cobalamin-binding protein n=2 Tax=Anaerovibrio lipolyticus TaxID=82374 RepID=A0A0B2K4F5_9FIRM|nr:MULTISPECIES: corrinoid protein [Anaerovibrio]KHM52962.1 cobalamin-binding protein [Anaerovibrio lipolyticus]MBO5588612.1 corrinoid protein [Anaerovibrio sp.]MBO6245418.1 corrinoid protein [Anaerovibrio sp.]SHI37058.1 methylmalonyl-CoA mutase C-terminal domain-containing protein/methyltransferase cognate corrinoid proteins [Anaerovibrio lipolyticus DSM 3074]